MAMRNPYDVYKQQTRISENKKLLNNSLQNQENTENEQTQKADASVTSKPTVNNQLNNTNNYNATKDVKTIQKENPYLFNSVMSSTPEELTILLFGGAVKFMKQAVACIKDNKVSDANHANQRAQAIFEELMCSLDQEGHPEMSQQLYSLYEYINYSLVDANIKKDTQMIEQMIEFTNELRTTWQEALKITKKKKAIN